MDENINPIEAALKQIQNWFVNGEFEKVKKGCQEVLSAAPNNSIAQDLLHKAEEAMAKGSAPESMPESIPSAPELAESPAPSGGETEVVASEGGAFSDVSEEPEPLAPTVEPSYTLPMPESILSEQPKTPENPMPMPAAGTVGEEIKTGKRSLAVNLGILVVILLVGVGLVYGYNAFFGSKDEAPEDENLFGDEVNTETEPVAEEEVMEDVEEEEVAEEEEPLPKLTLEERNEKRKDDLNNLDIALTYYYEDNSHYPAANEVNQVLVEEGYVEEIPMGPSVGEVYLYAVFDTVDGPNQAYVLSTGLENEDDTLTVYTTGGDPQTYTEFDVVDNENVTILHETVSEEDYFEWLAEQLLAEEESMMEEEPVDEEERVTRVPR